MKTHPSRSFLARSVAAVALLATCTALHAAAQTPTSPDGLSVTVRVDTTRFLSATTPIEVALSRPLTTADGELVLVVGGTDVTALAERTPLALTYRPSVEPLPAGTTAVVIYRQVGSHWTEVTRTTIKVLTAGGFRRVSAAPQATLGNRGQLASGRDGLPEPDRPTYQDFSLNGSLGTTHEHARFTLESSLTLVGSSRREEALRYGLRQAKAPRIDLSDYRLSLRSGGAALTVGHTTFGTSRHLVSGFGARGASLAWNRGGTSVGLTTMGGAATVGWDQLLPITNPDHRVTAASLGRELLPRRPGAMRVDATWLSASMLPRGAFTQGAVIDAESSEGGSVQLSAATPGQRLRLTTGLSRSRFDNPALDPQLTGAGNTAVVQVERETNTARFIETGVSPIQNLKVGGLGIARLSLGARHERVDPLYRSVASYVQSDRQHEGADASFGLGAVSGQVGVTRSRDNLASIPTLLTTRNRGRTTSLAIPLAPLFRVQKQARWFPAFNATLSRTQQAGDGVPTGGVFTPDQVPDQLSLMRDLGLQWQIGTWRLGIRSNRSEQDNRQVGRAAADFVTGANVVSLGWSFGATGDVSLDVGEDFQHTRERNERTRTRRATFNTNLRRGQSTSAVIALSLLRTTPPSGPVTLNGEQRVEITQPLNIWRNRNGASRGQVFLRFGRTTARIPDFALQATNPLAVLQQRQWTVSSGLNLRLF